jgi:hypothetical protein
MLKSLLFNGDKKCISYMTKIEYATDMCNILIWMSKLLGVEIEYWQIDCNTKKTIRQNIINNFIKSTKIAIIINVHILDEGINIKECDSVFITNPSKNIINIIQRMCRANRITENKSNCNIYLWYKEKKTNEILNYINDNTQDFIQNKVFIYNTENKIIEKYIIKNNNNNLINNNNNILLKDKLIEFIKNNNLPINFNLLLEKNTIKFENNNINIIIDKNNIIWFNANEIALTLGYKYPKDAIINNVDKKNKLKLEHININYKINKHPHSIYINESGLYSLLIKSRKKIIINKI